MSQAVDTRAARRRRIVLIRRTVLALSLAMFIALFSGLYVQMAAGRDPVLGSSQAAISTGSGSGTTSTSTSTSPPAAVTTSQS
jgi:hypothetical protein